MRVARRPPSFLPSSHITSPHPSLPSQSIGRSAGKFKIFLTKDGRRGLPNELPMALGNYSQVRTCPLFMHMPMLMRVGATGRVINQP